MLILPITSKIKEHLNDINDNVKSYLIKAYIPKYHPLNLIALYITIKKIRDFNPEIIHIQVGSSIIYPLVLFFLKKYPLISTFHDSKLHLGWERRIIAKISRYWLKKHSNKIFVHGKKLKEIMIKEYNLPYDKIQIIPMGENDVTPFIRYKRNLNECNNSILFFGRIRKNKGLDYLIKAEPIITKEIPNAKIIIAGKNDKYDNFKRYENLIINKKNFIIHNHYIDWKFGAELFEKACVIVLPYIEASQSGIIPVAYAFKKPIVVTNVGAIPEIVDDKKTGLIVPPKDPKALAKAIIKLLENKTLRKKMGENGYKKLKTNMSWDKINKITTEIYKKVLNKKQKKCADSALC